MIRKELTQTLVFAFHTTADAMAAEAAFKENAVSGRIIPVPRSMSAGCGLAWGMSPECRKQADAILAAAGILPEQTEEILIRF